MEKSKATNSEQLLSTDQHSFLDLRRRGYVLSFELT